MSHTQIEQLYISIPIFLIFSTNRASYTNALHALEKYKMRGLASILSFFAPKFKVNNTGARMINSIYHMILCLVGK